MADKLTLLERRNELFVCNYEGCNKRFKRKDRLKIHSRTHTGERPYMCTHPGCERCYCRLAHLVRHQQNAHTKVEDMVKFSCTESNCSKSFFTKFGLQRHIKTGHSREAELKYKCDFDGCGHSFRKRHLLQKHINSTHTMFDPYTCSYPGCSRTFKWPNLLRKHVKTHEGYICNVDGCSKTFDTWSLLSSHKRTDHSQEFICGVCGMTFPKKQQLKTHQKMHTDLRTPFPCPYDGCGRLYLEKRNLKMHLRRFHEKQRFACTHPACNKTFASKQKLHQHHGLFHDPNRPVPVKMEKQNSLKRHSRKPKKCKHSFASILTGLRDGQMTVQDIGCPPLKYDNQNHLGNSVDDRFESVNFPNQSLEKGFGVKISVFATTEVPKKEIKSKLETHMPFCQNSSITQEVCVSNGKDISNIPGNRDMTEERNDVQNIQGMMSGISASFQKELTATENNGNGGRDEIADALLELKREMTEKENSSYNGRDEMADVSLDLKREIKENSSYNGRDLISGLAIDLKETVKKITEEESHDNNGKNVMSDIAVDIKKEKDMTEKESIYYEGRDMMSEVVIDFQEENKEMTEKEFICNNERDIILMS